MPGFRFSERGAPAKIQGIAAQAYPFLSEIHYLVPSRELYPVVVVISSPVRVPINHSFFSTGHLLRGSGGT